MGLRTHAMHDETAQCGHSAHKKMWRRGQLPATTHARWFELGMVGSLPAACATAVFRRPVEGGPDGTSRPENEEDVVDEEDSHGANGALCAPSPDALSFPPRIREIQNATSACKQESHRRTSLSPTLLPFTESSRK